MPHRRGPSSDYAVVITEEGVFTAAIASDPASRSPEAVIVWAARGAVPLPTISAVQESEYARGLPVVSPERSASPLGAESTRPRDSAVVTAVRGSESDFDYQRPASPEHFVGREEILDELTSWVDGGSGSIVLNAQSGWGKSSLALRLKEIATARGGVGLVVDAWTASDSWYVVDALRRIVADAEAQQLVALSSDASWTSVSSALATIRNSNRLDPSAPVLLFFDQFESVFRDETVTRAFRDLVWGIGEYKLPILVGFAWKTDMVGLTEGYPYQLRDEIRSASTVVAVGRFDDDEVTTILRRVQNELREQDLTEDLQSRLRADSQRLPWLLKKLASHIIQQIAAGVPQEKLLETGLNVHALFEADLRDLSPQEREALNYIAKQGPLEVTDVMERYGPPLVQSLVDRRLIVQVGDHLDTYWDIFRDFLNTGRVPAQWTTADTLRRLRHPVPENVSLFELLQPEMPLEQWVRSNWGTATGLQASIGVAADGPVTLDFDRDGPNGLIAGTTGSGKSELLQTLIASLAVAVPPDRLNLLLIDYKGGVAFKECSLLPHTVGFVTDLDEHLARRALVSLNAELRHL